MKITCKELIIEYPGIDPMVLSGDVSEAAQKAAEHYESHVSELQSEIQTLKAENDYLNKIIEKMKDNTATIEVNRDVLAERVQKHEKLSQSRQKQKSGSNTPGANKKDEKVSSIKGKPASTGKKQCHFCGIEFKPKGNRQRFCSDTCKQQYIKHNLPDTDNF